MTKTRVSIKQIRELELDIANLEVTVSDKKQLLAELKLEQVDFAPREVADSGLKRKSSRSPTHACRAPKLNPRASDRKSSPSSSPPSSPTRQLFPITTGVFDSENQPIFIGDSVALRTRSSGKFARYFQRGNTAKVVGIASDSHLKLCVPGQSHIITRRSGFNVTKLRIL